MPFINSKVSVKLSEKQKETIKTRLGEGIRAIPGKSESWLMVGFEDEYTLYFKGNQDGPTAFVEVKIYGKASAEDYDRLTGILSQIFEEEAGVSPDRLYVTYQEISNWGWNGANF